MRVYFDADCGLCQASMRWLASRADVEAVPVHDAQIFRVTNDHGATFSGGDAWIECLRIARGYRWLAPILATPILRPLVRMGYTLVAANRRQISHCETPTPEPPTQSNGFGNGIETPDSSAAAARSNVSSPPRGPTS
jgi:predicted DCC family thiol-disulfide oxidoreductase YuxK